MTKQNWITPEEAAKLCGVTRASIHNWRKAGVFRTVRVEKSPRGEREYFHLVKEEVEAVAAEMVKVVRN